MEQTYRSIWFQFFKLSSSSPPLILATTVGFEIFGEDDGVRLLVSTPQI